jgi:hypothetical protein
LEKDVGRERLAEMLANPDQSLLEQGGTVIGDIARRARDTSPKAAEKLIGAIDARELDTPSRVRAVVDKVFGKKNSAQHADELAGALDPLATKLYESAFFGKSKEGGRTIKTLPRARFDELSQNPYIARAVERAPKVHLEVAGQKPNTLQRLDFAKEVLDGDIARELASPSPNTRLIRAMEEAKAGLTKTLEKASPAYKSGKNVSGNKLSALDAQRYGAKFDRADVSSDAFAERVGGMGMPELQGLRVGMRDFIKDGFEKINPEVFAKRLLDTDAQIKLRAALPAKEADDLTNLAKALRAQMDIRNRVKGGSMTSTNLGGAEDAIGTAERLTSATGLAKGLARLWDTKRERNTMSAMADILLARPGSIRAPEKRSLAELLKSSIGPSAFPRAAITQAALMEALQRRKEQ